MRSVWFDLDNSPHVPLFRPILLELSKAGQPFFVTSRSHAQTEGLLRFWGVEHEVVGVHAGKSKVRKVANLMHRSGQLARLAWGREVEIGVSHGSRTHLVACKALGVPHMWMTDYEYTENTLASWLATYILVPCHIPDDRLKAAGFNMRKLQRYNGFKEEVYLKDFVPDPDFRKTIGVGPDSVLITLRPPSLSANYHDARAEVLFQECLRHFAPQTGVHCLIVNRTEAEMRLIPEELRKTRNIAVLPRAVDGLQLIWNSDIVISGGGTMNRESALMGVPTYSIFTGRRPFLDEYLQEKGRLSFIEGVHQIKSLAAVKRHIPAHFVPENRHLAAQIVELLLDLLKKRK